jgi:DNA-3-methyladenine glycosylase I
MSEEGGSAGARGTDERAGASDDDGTCGWATGSAAMRRYHDEEWGRPSRDDRHLFEMIVLEGAQAGLSWSTILNRREGYARAFKEFDVEAVAGMGDQELEALMNEPAIIRNRLKIFGTRKNALTFIAVQRECRSPCWRSRARTSSTLPRSSASPRRTTRGRTTPGSGSARCCSRFALELLPRLGLGSCSLGRLRGPGLEAAVRRGLTGAGRLHDGRAGAAEERLRLPLRRRLVAAGVMSISRVTSQDVLESSPRRRFRCRPCDAAYRVCAGGDRRQ